GNSPPARKLASLPLTAIRLGSARICNRFFCCGALITPPRVFPLRARKRCREAETVTVGGVVVVVVVVVLPGPVVVVCAVLWTCSPPNCPVWERATVFPFPRSNTLIPSCV